MAERITLHRVRLDVLLWALGGFAEATSEPPRERCQLYTDWQRQELRRLARAARVECGEAKELAQRWGRNPKSLHVMVCRMRKESRAVTAAV